MKIYFQQLGKWVFSSWFCSTNDIDMPTTVNIACLGILGEEDQWSMAVVPCYYYLSLTTEPGLSGEFTWNRYVHSYLYQKLYSSAPTVGCRVVILLSLSSATRSLKKSITTLASTKIRDVHQNQLHTRTNDRSQVVYPNVNIVLYLGIYGWESTSRQCCWSGKILSVDKLSNRQCSISVLDYIYPGNL